MFNNSITLGIVKPIESDSGEVPGLSDILAISNRDLKYIDDTEYYFVTGDETKEIVLNGSVENPINLYLVTETLPLESELIINAFKTNGFLNYGDDEVRYSYKGVITQLGDSAIEIPLVSNCIIRNVENEDYFFVTIENITSNQSVSSWKEPARLKIDVPIPMTGLIPTIGLQDFQGITLVDNDRVVLSAQTLPKYNGIYYVRIVGDFYRFYRSADANVSSELNGAIIDILQGDNKEKQFLQTTVNPVIGTSDIVFKVVPVVPQATNIIAGILKLYNAIGSEIDGAITPNAILLALASKQNTLAFTSYASATITIGWSSFTQKRLWYIDFSTHCLFFYHLEGAGSGVNSSFTIPFNATENSTSQHIPMSNGTYFNNPGRGEIVSGSNVVNLYATLPGSSWSAGTSNKIASGLILIKK